MVARTAPLGCSDEQASLADASPDLSGSAHVVDMNTGTPPCGSTPVENDACSGFSPIGCCLGGAHWVCGRDTHWHLIAASAAQCRAG